MRSPFYQANFCAECGNSLPPRSIFRSRYFCDACAARLKQRSLLTPLAGVLLIASLAVFAFSYKRNGGTVWQTNLPAQNFPVSAQDAVVGSKPKPPVVVETRVLCGARTLRGTPCRRRVLPGERCAQHRGRPSMLDSAARLSPAESGGKSRKH